MCNVYVVYVWVCVCMYNIDVHFYNRWKEFCKWVLASMKRKNRRVITIFIESENDKFQKA